MPGVEPTPLALLMLGRQKDPASERGVDCPGELPAASDPTLVERARRAKDALGERVFVLGHHYQRDEVIQFADVTGDSFKLAQQAAARPEAEFVVFAGVHFMAESADILTGPTRRCCCPTSPPAARWPTWRPSTRSSSAGRTCGRRDRRRPPCRSAT
jgi:quinolinate synthase